MIIVAVAGVAVGRFSNFRLWHFQKTLERTFTDSHCNGAFMCTKKSFKRAHTHSTEPTLTHVECHCAHSHTLLAEKYTDKNANNELVDGEGERTNENGIKYIRPIQLKTMFTVQQRYYQLRPALTVRYCSAYLFLFLQFFYSTRSRSSLAIVSHALLNVGVFLRCEIGALCGRWTVWSGWKLNTNPTRHCN